MTDLLWQSYGTMATSPRMSLVNKAIVCAPVARLFLGSELTWVCLRCCVCNADKPQYLNVCGINLDVVWYWLCHYHWSWMCFSWSTSFWNPFPHTQMTRRQLQGKTWKSDDKEERTDLFTNGSHAWPTRLLFYGEIASYEDEGEVMNVIQLICSKVFDTWH